MKSESRKRILIVDDEENLRHLLSILLKKQGFSADCACDGEDALEKLTARSYDYVLSDIMMPKMDGKTLLGEIFARSMDTTVIMMSAYGTIDTAIECMKLGAYDYISKPFKNDEIVLVLKKAEERERLKEENRQLKQVVSSECSFAGIISRNPLMKKIFGLVSKVADYKTTVLITGESGTGKELIAKALHSQGARRAQPFVAVNCAAIPENLLESELFGHVRGAFTDAATDKAGLFEQADNGTLFLDEIGEMPLSLQVKLLRVIQEEEIRRVGGNTSKKVNVRLVSATSRSLEDDVSTGRFREDLFFRLNVFAISLPPLRERLDDIPLLVEHFLERFSARFGKKVTGISAGFMDLLTCYNWPGNVRELENVMERGVILCDGDTLEASALPAKIAISGNSPFSPTPETMSIKQAGEAMERELIRRALASTGGNRTHAARLLEISLRSLIYKIKEYGLE